ncbi:MAG TPA: hypothetical protein VJ844_06765 [Mucilaginibacter sp.]|nr:hypothetical protein [Mucilaginibacter sp.]
MLEAEVLLINNTNDTLVYGKWWGQESQFYRSDNENLVATNFDLGDHPPIYPDTIWPRGSYSGYVHFRFKQMPDTTFNFRIGMSLLKWQKKYSNADPNSEAIRQAPVLWSETEVFKTDREHHTYEKTPDEYKKQCEQVVDTLTDKDRHNYILSIEQHNITIFNDTMAYFVDSARINKNDYNGGYKQFGVVTVPVKLSNNSNSVLTYTNYNCTSHDIYETNNKAVILMQQFCTRNFSETFTISPNKSSILYIPVLFEKKVNVRSYKFKIGMALLGSHIGSFVGFRDAIPLFKRDPKYVIWSNEVKVVAAK